MTTRTFTFRGYQLICTAIADPRGRFDARLLAASMTWPSRPRTVEVQRVEHATPDAAIEQAYQQGIKWVGEHG